MINRYFNQLLMLLLCSYVFSGAQKESNESEGYYESYYSLDQDSQARGGIGQFGFPSNPMNDRAKGYLLNGVIKNAVSNYGNFITWDEHPAGLWGEYSYLPH